MDIPADTLKRLTAPKAHAPRSEREELVDRFRERLNPARVKEGLKPLTYTRMAKLLEGKSVSEMHRLFKECESARSFGRLFWHVTKKK